MLKIIFTQGKKVYGNLEEKLDNINNEIDKLEFDLRVCESHIQYIGDIKKSETDKITSKNYESLISHDTYRRMAMQDKLRKLMRESMELQDKLCINSD